MMDEIVSGRPPRKKSSLWFSTDVLFSGNISAFVVGFLVREKEMSIDVEVSGMKMDFAAMRVKASEGFLHGGAEREVLRSFGTLIAWDMRSSMSALRSLVRVA